MQFQTTWRMNFGNTLQKCQDKGLSSHVTELGRPTDCIHVLQLDSKTQASRFAFKSYAVIMADELSAFC